MKTNRIRISVRDWRLQDRYFVNEPTNHLGSTWQNLTGRNSEPGEGNPDWKNISSADGGGGRSLIVVNGNIFTLAKNPNNSGEGLENNDLIVGGMWDATTYWGAAQYIGGDKDTLGAWNPLQIVKGIVLV